MVRVELHFLLILLIFLGNELVLVFLLHALLGFLFTLGSADQFIEGLGIIVIDIFVNSSFESFHQLLLYFLLNIGGNQGLGFPNAVPLLSFLLDGDQFFLALQFKLPHLDDHLPEFGKPLLAFVDDER